MWSKLNRFLSVTSKYYQMHSGFTLLELLCLSSLPSRSLAACWWTASGLSDAVFWTPLIQWCLWSWRCLDQWCVLPSARLDVLSIQRYSKVSYFIHILLCTETNHEFSPYLKDCKQHNKSVLKHKKKYSSWKPKYIVILLYYNVVIRTHNNICQNRTNTCQNRTWWIFSI